MERVLACVDLSEYASPVCQLAGWTASRLGLPVELLHVVQRPGAVAERHDLSGAIGLGVKADLLEELTRLEARARGSRSSAAGRCSPWPSNGCARRGPRRPRSSTVTAAPLRRRARGRCRRCAVDGQAAPAPSSPRGISAPGSSGWCGGRVGGRLLVASRAFEAPSGRSVLAFDGSPARRALERCAGSRRSADLLRSRVVAGRSRAGGLGRLGASVVRGLAHRAPGLRSRLWRT